MLSCDYNYMLLQIIIQNFKIKQCDYNYSWVSLVLLLRGTVNQIWKDGVYRLIVVPDIFLFINYGITVKRIEN